MIQQINLYRTGGPAPPPWLSLNGQLLLAGALIAALSLFSLTTLFQTRILGAEVARLEAATGEAQAQLSGFMTAHPARQASRVLQDSVDQAMAERQMLAGVIDAIQRANVSARQGFSNALGALARQTVEGLWLTSVQFAQGGRSVRIAGNVVDPALVPRLFQQLAGEDSFAGREFERFAMIRPVGPEGAEVPWIEFSTQTAEQGKAP